MFNTIILKKGYEKFTQKEYQNFQKGDTIWGEDSNPKELKRWGIVQEQDAKKELAKYKCSCNGDYVLDVTEYALEYCECDEDGEFIQGSDFELAEIENAEQMEII